MTELLYQTDAYLKEFTARVIAVEGSAVMIIRLHKKLRTPPPY
jgi:Ser-tRNA(Ala) deacylase AlaX